MRLQERELRASAEAGAARATRQRPSSLRAFPAAFQGSHFTPDPGEPFIHALLKGINALVEGADASVTDGMFLFTTADQATLDNPTAALTQPVWDEPREQSVPVALTD